MVELGFGKWKECDLSKKVRRVSGARLSSWLGLKPKREEEDEHQHPYGQHLTSTEKGQSWGSKSAQDLSAPKWPRVSISSLSSVWKSGRDGNTNKDLSPYIHTGTDSWRISAPQLVKTEEQRSFAVPVTKQPNPQRHTMPVTPAVLASWDTPEEDMSLRRYSTFDSQSAWSVPNSPRSSKYEFKPPNRLSDPRASGIIESLRSTSALFMNATPLQRRPAIKRRRHENIEGSHELQDEYMYRESATEIDDQWDIISDDGRHSFVKAQEDVIDVPTPIESEFDSTTNWPGPERAIVAPVYEPLPLSGRLPLTPITSSVRPTSFSGSKAQYSPKQQTCPRLTITLPPTHQSPLTPPSSSKPTISQNDTPLFNIPTYDEPEKPVFDQQKRSFTEPLRPVSLPANIPPLIKRKTVPTEALAALANEMDLGVHPSQRPPSMDPHEALLLSNIPSSRTRRGSRSQLPSSPTHSPPYTPRSVSTSWDEGNINHNRHSKSIHRTGINSMMSQYSTDTA